ncbi:MAG: DUF1934 domain-containing protein [Oscillospiraceae bacterium]|jgi:uncharacterized beta-barrel protein YwiB (DUF1934 family)|nr:DUF1934 domain-containing protein [Oscillospiraceae bacterium]
MKKNDLYTITIDGQQTSPGSDEETFRLVTDGEYVVSRGGKSQISYFDSDVTGSPDDTKTVFVVEPSRITLTRGSWFGADMVFDTGEKHHFLYETPFGSLTMGVETEYISRELTKKGGDLKIRYSLDVDNVIISRNSYTISVKPC